MPTLKSTLLIDRRIAILATDGFEEAELVESKKALENAGAKVIIVSIQRGRIKAWKNGDWGMSIHVDESVDQAKGFEYDSLLIPGGVLNADKLRSNERVISFIHEFIEDDKTIASLCHGPEVLIDAGVTKGKHLTSWPSLKTDLINSGAVWMDQDVVVDEHLITGRSLKDIDAFNEKMIYGFSHSARRM